MSEFIKLDTAEAENAKLTPLQKLTFLYLETSVDVVLNEVEL